MESDDQLQLYFLFIWLLSIMVLFYIIFVLLKKMSNYIGNRASSRKTKIINNKQLNSEFSAIHDSDKEPWEIESPGNDSESNLTDTSNNQIVEEISGSFFSRQGFNFVLFVGMILATIIVTDMGDSYQYNDGQEIIYCDENQQIIIEEQFRDGNNDCLDGSDEKGFFAIFFLSVIWAPLQYRMIKNSRSKFLSKLRSIKPISKVILQVYIWIIIWASLLITYSLIDIIIFAIVALIAILPAYLLVGWILSPIENYLYKNLKSLIEGDIDFVSAFNNISDLTARYLRAGTDALGATEASETRSIDLDEEISEVDWTTLLILSVLLGVMGVDRFFSGHIGLGVLKFLTFGGFGIWALVDVIMIATGNFRDGEGKLVVNQ